MVAPAATAANTATTQEKIPNWRVIGDWFDVCSCNIACPCEFAQAPTYGDCEGILAYNIKEGSYGETPLDGLNVLLLSYFKGNIWAGDGNTKLNLASIFHSSGTVHKRLFSINECYSLLDCSLIYSEDNLLS